MWDPASVPTVLVDLAAQALMRRRDALVAEHAVRGLDALSEVQLHPLIAGGIAAAGLGVFAETPYPGQPKSRPRHAERLRCDLVITPSPELPPLDPVAEINALDAAEGTLFAPAAASMLERSRRGTEPSEAYWLEIKTVGQHTFHAGVPGPSRAYATQLLTVVPSDIPKLAGDAVIRHAGVLLVLFTASEKVAQHDLATAVHRCLDRGLPVSTPHRESFSIPDMIGNTRCTLALIPVRPGGGVVDVNTGEVLT